MVGEDWDALTLVCDGYGHGHGAMSRASSTRCATTVPSGGRET